MGSWTLLYVMVLNTFDFHPYLGRLSNLTNIQMRWNHQLVLSWKNGEVIWPGWSSQCSGLFGGKLKSTKKILPIAAPQERPDFFPQLIIPTLAH